MIFYKKKQNNFNNSKFVEVEVLPVDESFNRKTQSKTKSKTDGWYSGWIGSTEKRPQTRPINNVASKGFFSGTNVRTLEFKKNKQQVYDYRGYDENQAVREYERKKELEKEYRKAVPLKDRTYKVPLKKLGKYKHHKADKAYSYKTLRQKSPMGEPLFWF